MGLMRHPALLLAIAWVALLVLVSIRRRAELADPAVPRGLMFAASIAVIVSYCAIVVWYTFKASYFDAAEPTITSVAAAFASGQPLYPALDAPERYAHIYGPILFIVHAAAFEVAGASILASKAVGSVAALSSLGLTYVVYSRRAGVLAASNVTAASALVYLCFSNATFWTRSDPLLILFASIGLAGALSSRRLAAAIVLGLATGAAINLKVTGAIYLIPVFAIALSRHGAGVAAVAAALAVVAAGVPFLLPQISLSHYLDYLRLSARNGLLGSKLLENAEWGVFLLTPLLVTWWAARNTRLESEARHAMAGLTCAVGVIAIVSAKPGGGSFHFLPFVPIMGFTISSVARGTWTQSSVTRVAVAFAITATAIAVPRQLIFIRTVSGRHLERAIADVRQFADETPSKRTAVGYAGTSYLSHVRPELVFRTGDYLIDAPAVQEHRLSGLEIPGATIRAIDDCRFDYWLLPDDAQPFDVPSAYQPLGPESVFSAQFRLAFLRRYVRVNRTALFDVWECRRRAGGAGN
jgi:hypothetical protein